MSRPSPRPTPRGFTLIEVIVAVAIVGILAAIAVPAYRSHVERTHRGVARAALSEVASRQESHYLDRKRYATTLGPLGWAGDPLYLQRNGALTASSANAIYRIRLQGNPTSLTCPSGGNAAGGGYTAVAEPTGAQAGDTACGTLCLSSTGIKSASGSQADTCWSR